MTKIYTGIGARQTPPEILTLLTRIARTLEGQGYVLRSGGAAGADTAFAQGTARCEIYLPWAGFNGVPDGIVVHGAAWAQAEGLVRALHPAWPRLSPGVLWLHTSRSWARPWTRRASSCSSGHQCVKGSSRLCRMDPTTWRSVTPSCGLAPAGPPIRFLRL